MSGGQIGVSGSGGVIYGDFQERSSITFMAYVTNADGTLLTSGLVTDAVGITVYQNSGATPTTAVYANKTDYPASSAIHGLSTTGWTRGGSGYNFSLTIPATSFSTYGGITYRYEFQINFAAGGYTTLVFELFCRGII